MAENYYMHNGFRCDVIYEPSEDAVYSATNPGSLLFTRQDVIGGDREARKAFMACNAL